GRWLVFSTHTRQIAPSQSGSAGIVAQEAGHPVRRSPICAMSFRQHQASGRPRLASDQGRPEQRGIRRRSLVTDVKFGSQFPSVRPYCGIFLAAHIGFPAHDLSKGGGHSHIGIAEVMRGTRAIGIVGVGFVEPLHFGKFVLAQPLAQNFGKDFGNSRYFLISCYGSILPRLSLQHRGNVLFKLGAGTLCWLPTALAQGRAEYLYKLEFLDRAVLLRSDLSKCFYVVHLSLHRRTGWPPANASRYLSGVKPRPP